MDLLQAFKRLPKGYYRLIIVGWIITPIILGIYNDLMKRDDYAFIIGIVWGIPLYYILARLGVWIYEGFKNDKQK